MSAARRRDGDSRRRNAAKRQVVVYARAPVARRRSVASVVMCVRALRAVILECGDPAACRCTRLVLPVISAEIAHALVRSASLPGAASPHRQRRGATSIQPILQCKSRLRDTRSSVGSRRRQQPRHGCTNIASRSRSRNPQPRATTAPDVQPGAKFVPAPRANRPSSSIRRRAFVRVQPAGACSR